MGFLVVRMSKMNLNSIAMEMKAVYAKHVVRKMSNRFWIRGGVWQQKFYWWTIMKLCGRA